jgi:O-antigen/teichoic acid export membrane protein
MIIQHTLIYTAVKFVPAIASLLALMTFTRLMSPAQFGEYSLTVSVATTLVAIFAQFLIIGLGRFEPVIKTDLEKDKLHSTVLLTAVMLSFSITVFIALLASFGALPKLSINFLLLAILFHVSLLLMLNQKLLNANLLPKRYGVSLVLKNVLLLILASSSLLLGFGASEVLISLATATLIASLPGMSLWGKTSFKLFDLNTFKQLWRYGAPLTLLYLFVMIINLSDRLFIDVMLGSAEVGIYSANYDLTQFTIGLVASIIHLAAFPIIVKAYETEGEEKAKQLLAMTIKILLLMMVPITFGFIAVREEIATIFLGAEFSSAASMLIPILALSVLLSTIKSYYFDYTFQLTKATWLQAIPPLIAAILNCILNYFLISHYGLIGAAYSTLISFTLYLTLTVFLSNRVFKLPVFPWMFLIKVIASAIFMLLVVFSLTIELPVILLLLFKVLIGIITFVLCIALLLRNEALNILKILKGKVNGI